MKQSQNNNFDQFVKGILEDASVPPPAFIWNKIERELPPVLPWYSKYKYLLLLLFLCFTSGSAILTYKFIKDNKHGNIAANKTRVTDEHSNTEINNTQATGNTTDKIASAATTIANPDALSSKKTITTVSSFYSNNKNDTSLDKTKTGSTAKSALEKRNNRVKRFAVNSTSTGNNITINKSENNSFDTVKSKKEKNTIGKLNTNNVESDALANNAFADNTTTASSSDIATEKQDRKKIKKEIKSKEVLASNLAAVNSINKKDNHLPVLESNSTGVNVNSPIDISPIAEPVRAKESEEFTASVTPLKLNTTPLNSRDVMRSLIEPAKLEMLDFEASAGVEDLNPNKEKMMRNLKQFAGYNINQGFHIGVFISINNIWLSNKEFSCSENVSSIKPKFDFGKSYGLNIGYDYSDRWGIELEAQYAEQGQKYTETSLSNNNASKEVNLNYLKLPLMIKYKQSFINSYNSKPIVMSFLFGPQIGFLLKKEAKIDGKSAVCSQSYSKVETGLAAGLDFDLYMMRYMYLTIGARTGFGTSFKKGVPVSYQIGVTTQFNFRIPKKLK